MLLINLKNFAQLVFLVSLITSFQNNSFAQKEDRYVDYGMVKINTVEQRGQQVDFLYTSKYYGSATVFVTFDKLDNAIHYSKPIVIKGSSGRLFTLKPTIAGSINFSYRFKYIQGALKPKVDKYFTYTLPFIENTTFKAVDLPIVALDTLASRLKENWKAYTFESPSDNIVCASRMGIVIKVKKKQGQRTSLNGFSEELNSVWVEHRDGTIAEYAGFDAENIFVKEGQKVQPQTILGKLDEEDKLYFRVEYLAELIMEKKQRDVGRMECINPIFVTDEAEQTLKSDETYKVKVDEALITLEMTKREKKKRTKK